MFDRRLCIAIAAVAALLVAPQFEVRQEGVDTRDAGRIGLMDIIVPGGPYVLGADGDSGARTSQVQLALENAGVPPSERAASADGGSTPQAPEGAPGRRAEGGGTAATAGTQPANPPTRPLRRRQDAGDLVAQALAPIDDMIRENGVSFRSSHFAEDCRDWDPQGCGYYQGHASRFVFAIEATDGKVSEYSLCAAAGPDGQHGLYVSVCEYHAVAEQREGKDGKPEVFHGVVIDRIYLVKPNALSLGLRAQMLDEVSQGNFMRAYQQYVRQKREGQAGDSVTRPWLQKGAK
jgi:hypothetical protein